MLSLLVLREFSGRLPPLVEMRYMVLSVQRTRTRKQRVQPESVIAITFKDQFPVTYSQGSSLLRDPYHSKSHHCLWNDCVKRVYLIHVHH